MAITLAEASQLNPNALSAQIFQDVALISDIMSLVPVIPKKGQGYTAFREGTAPTIASRAVNAAYTENAGGDSTPKSFAYKIMGGTIDVDKALVEREGLDSVVDLRVQALYRKIKALKFFIHNLFVNGDSGSVATDFDGLIALIAGGNGNNVSLGTNGVNILASLTTKLDFLQLLDETIARIPGCNALLTNAKNKAILTRIARELGFYNTQVNQFGQVIEFYGRVQMIDIGTKADGTEIITNTETQGSSSLSSSMYLLKADADTGLTFASPQNIESDEFVIDHGLVSGASVYRHMLDLQLTLAVQDKFSVTRVKGILIA